MELVLYYIKESAGLLISFLILIFVLGIFAYLTMRNFRQDSKLKVGFYGLFLGLKNIDIIKLSIIIVRIFLLFFCTMLTTNDNIYMYIIMITLLSLLYIVLNFKKIVNEIVATLMGIVMIYFIYSINGYIIEIEYNVLLLIIKICLIVFTLLFTTYFGLRDLNDTIESRWNKELKKERKVIKDDE